MRSVDLQMAINSPKLKRVLAHWHEARGNRLMPKWESICPARIKTELTIVWSYHYDALQDDFLGGIAGDAIQRLLGGPIKNARFRQVHDAEPHFFARAKRVLFVPTIFLGRGLLFRQRNRQCYGERLILPFGDANGLANGIFGATDYKFSHLYTSELEVCSEVEHWFDLTIPAGSLSVRAPETARYAKNETAEVS